MDDLSRLLQAADDGDERAAEDLLPLVYDELRRVAGAQMKAEAAGQTLTPTALVHEAYLRLVKGDPQRPWRGRRHFFHAAALAMRRILVDQARRKRALKRGGQQARHDVEAGDIAAPDVPDDLLELDEALDRLAAHDAEAARLVQLRCFSGLTVPEAAEVLGIGARSADRLWVYARAWLFEALRESGE